MAKYFVRIPVFADWLVTVEADNESSAIDKALKNFYPNLCHSCADLVELSEIDPAGDITAEEKND